MLGRLIQIFNNRLKTIVARARYSFVPVVAAPLGRTLTAARLWETWWKRKRQPYDSHKRGGPLGSIIAVSDSCGNVRLCRQSPNRTSVKRKRQAGWGRVIGKDGFVPSAGILAWRAIRGIYKARVGEIAEDMAQYLAETEQTESAIGLEFTARDTFSGRFLIQLLPERLWGNRKAWGKVKICPVTTVLWKGAHELVNILTGGFDKVLTREEVFTMYAVAKNRRCAHKLRRGWA